MSVDYALVTSSSIPSEVKQSANYVVLKKKQWLDLVDYAEEVANNDTEHSELLFLICARGTAEQEAADKAQKSKKEEEAEDLEAAKSAARLLEESRKERESERESEGKRLREKSESIFNSLYGR